MSTQYFYFSAHTSRNILITMSQLQTQHIQSNQGCLESGLNEQKVNPEAMIQNGLHETYEKCDDISEQICKSNVNDPQTPKRNKSEQKSTVSSDKYTLQKHSQSVSHSTPTTLKNRFKNSERIPEEEEEPDHKNYQDLTNKLEIVLNKIASTSKTINNSVSQNENLMVRFEECEQRKKKLIDKKKEEYEQHKTKELKQKPTIDKNSNKISKEIGHKPIYLRVDAMVQEKKKKLEKNEEMRKRKLEEEQQTFIEQYNKHVKKPQNIRTYDQYFSQMVRWKEKRLQENKQKLQMKQTKQLEGITFQPILNSKSKKMVSSHQRLPIEQRGLVKAKKPKETIKTEESKTYKKVTPNI